MTTTALQPLPSMNNSQKLRRALPYYAAYLIMGMALSVLGPTLLSLADQTSSSLAEISIIIAGNSLGVVLGSLLGGSLYDRWRGHPVFAISTVVLGGMLVTLPFISSRCGDAAGSGADRRRGWRDGCRGKHPDRVVIRKSSRPFYECTSPQLWGGGTPGSPAGRPGCTGDRWDSLGLLDPGWFDCAGLHLVGTASQP